MFYTSICANYLGKALALASSVKRLYPDSQFVIGLVEREMPPLLDLARYPAVDCVVLARELVPVNEFDGWLFRYSIVEAATAIKGRLLRHLYSRFPAAEHFVYLDPDTYAYSPFDELFEQLAAAPIVITPHLEVPGNLEMELSALQHGVFNLGFLAVARDPETERFIDWWVARLDFACYDAIPSGIFTDQKWINLVPCFFRCAILRASGYNFATWSLLDRQLTRDESGRYMVNGQPLRFAHFSGFDSGTFHRCVRQWAERDSELLYAFADEYDRSCKQHQAMEFRRIPWSYAQYLSGSVIWRLARIVWRECFGQEGGNPFAHGNLAIVLMSFKKRRFVRLLNKLIKRYV